MKRLFIVSNRLPVQIFTNESGIRVQAASGGLVSAISSYIEKSANQNSNLFNDITWVGIPGCDPNAWVMVQNQMPATLYKYLPVFVSDKVYDEYYNGLSNSMLWPLFHYFPSYTEYSTSFYRSYVLANEAFMQTLQSQLKEDDVVWIHDYHLLPLAGLIRERFPVITIGFFLHIPFPSYELFRMMPGKWQKDLLHGMLGADLIGFHTIDYAAHFLQSVETTIGLKHKKNMLLYQNRLLKVGVFPISIDYTKFHTAYDDKDVAVYRDTYRMQMHNKKIIFSVDRLDYTKGVFGRLRAYERFLKKYPEYKEKVVFIMNIIPSRDSIKKYVERKSEIDEFIGALNSSVGKISWKPVVYQYMHLSFAELIALYTACDVALITPLRDGMNLVAKEFVCSRKDGKGVLILSEMAGAARELADALTINPNDIEGTADMIKQGIEMPADEQAKRILKMQKRIKQYDVVAWASDFVTQLFYMKQQQTE